MGVRPEQLACSSASGAQSSSSGVKPSAKTTKEWLACCNGEFIREDSVMWISEEYKGAVLIGTVDGNTYTAPPVEVCLLKGFMLVPMYDNGITTRALEDNESDSDALLDEESDTEEWNSEVDNRSDCDGEDSDDPDYQDSETEDDSSMEEEDDPVVTLGEDLLKLYFRTKYIVAVYMQCADPDSDGDYSYALVLPDGAMREVFCELPMYEVYHHIEFDDVQMIISDSDVSSMTKRGFIRPTPVQYENKILDHGVPRYVVCFRPDRVTCYSNIKPVSEREAFGDVMLDNGHCISNVWLSGESWQYLHDVVLAQ